jgi:hypothetical protein
MLQPVRDLKFRGGLHAAQEKFSLTSKFSGHISPAPRKMPVAVRDTDYPSIVRLTERAPHLDVRTSAGYLPNGPELKA